MNFGPCDEKLFSSRIKLDDANCKRQAVIVNEEQVEYIRTRYDGCVAKNTVAADWIVWKAGYGQLIVELKGKNVDHATKQVLATAERLATSKLLKGKTSALVVATEYPRFSTGVQKAASRFAKFYGGPLHVVTKNYEFCFDHLLSFKGPFKSA
jgi:hypothetical protein